MHKIHSTTLSSLKKKLVALRRILTKSRLFVGTLSAVLFLGLLIAPGFSTSRQEQSEQPSLDANRYRSWELAQTFRPPDRGAPASTEGAASRQVICTSKEDQLAILTPRISRRDLGLTVSPYPTFLVYIPNTTAKTGELILKEYIIDSKKERDVYRTTLTLPTQSGIVSISLPKTEQPLEVGKQYKWWFRLVCSVDQEGTNWQMTDNGWLERIQPSESLANQLTNAKPGDLPALYANAGIWHEALASAANLRHSQPNDATVAANWAELLRSAGLEKLVQKPLVDCCEVKSSSDEQLLPKSE